MSRRVYCCAYDAVSKYNYGFSDKPGEGPVRNRCKQTGQVSNQECPLSMSLLSGIAENGSWRNDG